MPDPLPLADFFDGLRVQSTRFSLPGVRQHSRTASGEVLTAVLGQQLWQGEVTLTPGYDRDIASIQAQLEDLDRAGDPFLIHPFPCGPAHDPNGSIIAGHNPEIAAVSSDRIRLRNLPSGYSFRRGDFLSFEYGDNPVRYALHRVMDLTSTGLGSGMRVSPRPRPGVAVGAAVTLYKPVCKAVVVPGSIRWPSSSLLISDGISFSFIQTLG